MRRKKKTTIVTFESHERVTIQRHERSWRAWCDRCGREVLMVTPNEAAAIDRTDERSIFRGVEAGTIHFIESPGVAVMICSQSLRVPPRPQG